MIDAISGAIAGLRTAVDMTKAAIDTRDAVKIAEAKAAIVERLLDVQSACQSLQERNATLMKDKHALAQEKRELEDQIVQIQQHIDKLANYERFQTPVGAIVFIDKSTKESTNGPVYACATCMDNRKISTLQPIYKGKELHCHIHGAFGFDEEPQRGPIGMLIPKKPFKAGT